MVAPGGHADALIFNAVRNRNMTAQDGLSWTLGFFDDTVVYRP